MRAFSSNAVLSAGGADGAERSEQTPPLLFTGYPQLPASDDEALVRRGALLLMGLGAASEGDRWALLRHSFPIPPGELAQHWDAIVTSAQALAVASLPFHCIEKAA